MSKSVNLAYMTFMKDWTDEYKAIRDDLKLIYDLLEDSFFDIVHDVEQDTPILLHESEIYERTIKTIEKYLKRVQIRIEHLKTLEPPINIEQANTITNQINKITENVHGFYENIFNNSELANQLDNVGEKLSIRIKCNDYFATIQNLHDLFKQLKYTQEGITNISL